MMAPAKRLLLVAAATTALRPTKLPPLQKQAKALGAALAAVGLALAPLASIAEETSAGFEEFAAKGGTMEAKPQCFFDECGDQSKACFGNPSCLKGVTCLGNCRGEQECGAPKRRRRAAHGFAPGRRALNGGVFPLFASYDSRKKILI